MNNRSAFCVFVGADAAEHGGHAGADILTEDNGKCCAVGDSAGDTQALQNTDGCRGGLDNGGEYRAAQHGFARVAYAAGVHIVEHAQALAQQLRRELRKIPEKVTRLAIAEGCDLLILAGDLFDGKPSRDTVEAVKDAQEKGLLKLGETDCLIKELDYE